MKSKSKWFENLFFGKIEINNTYSNVAILLLRIYAGYTIMVAGLDKLPLTDWMSEQVASMGFPFPDLFAWIASWGEFAFGCLLLLGLMTRFSGLILAIIMGVASFGFQKVIPLGEMHIAQHFFWIFVLFTGIGAGRISFDHYIGRSELNFRQKMLFTGIPSIVVLLAIGLFLENTPNQTGSVSNEDPFMIESVNIAGDFNDWDPSTAIMLTEDSVNYQIQLDFEKPQTIQFKFTTNESWDFNLGETNQEKTGFPIDGFAEPDNNNNTQNIKAYIPGQGSYLFELNIENYRYSLDTLNY